MELIPCFIIPTYKETETIHQLIIGLHEIVPSLSRLIIVDDSPDRDTLDAIQSALNITGWDQAHVKILRNNVKGGRGHAVKLGMKQALLDKNIGCFIEMDSDGSHTPEMAMRVANEISRFDFCIGSRYISQSRIVGWSLQRRIFSRVINSLLRLIFTRHISDWTNGLRAYSRAATEELCRHESITKGFIYLSEQAIILNNHQFGMNQVPITFQERTHGSSTVTWREIADSITGVIKIIKNRKSLEKS